MCFLEKPFGVLMTVFGVGFIGEGVKFDEGFGFLTSSVLVGSYGFTSSCVISRRSSSNISKTFVSCLSLYFSNSSSVSIGISCGFLSGVIINGGSASGVSLSYKSLDSSN